SAWTSASRITANEPISQAMMAAGPPISEQARAPNSQPDPMIDPSEVSRSPKNPMSRVSPSPVEASPWAEAPAPGETVVWLISTLPVVEFRCLDRPRRGGRYGKLVDGVAAGGGRGRAPR